MADTTGADFRGQAGVRIWQTYAELVVLVAAVEQQASASYSSAGGAAIISNLQAARDACLAAGTASNSDSGP